MPNIKVQEVYLAGLSINETATLLGMTRENVMYHLKALNTPMRPRGKTGNDFVKDGVRMRKCYQCKAVKPITQFSRSPQDKDGYGWRCLGCPARPYLGVNFKKYGITRAIYEEMVSKQDGKCLICGLDPGYPLHIDHCHSTGRVRGLLCNPCNQGIGFLRDSPEILERAKQYLAGDL